MKRVLKQAEPYIQKLGYTKEQFDEFKMILESVDALMQKATPLEWDQEGTKLVDGKVVLPGNMEAVLKELIEDNAIYTLFIPEKLGGYGYGSFFNALLGGQLAKVDIAFHTLMLISLAVMEQLFLYYREEYQPAIDRFAKGETVGYVGFTEPEAGSNLANVKTTSELDGDEYVINGEKIFISDGGYGKIGIVLARNMVNGKQEGTNVFLVDSLEGITIERLEHKMGLRANPTAVMRFDNVRVPKEYLVGPLGDGYKKVIERLMGMRVGVVWQAIGGVLRAYDLAREYAENRVQFKKPIISFDGVSRKINEAEKEVNKLITVGLEAAFAHERYLKGWVPFETGANGAASAEKEAASMVPGAARGGMAHYYVSRAKLYASEAGYHLVDDMLQVFGGNGFMEENEVNKILRDFRVLRIYEGTSEIHEFILGKSMQAWHALNLEPKTEPQPETYYERMVYQRFPSLKGVLFPERK